MGITYEPLTHVEKSPLIKAMISAVQDGGALAKDYFKHPETIAHVKKSDDSIQTNADIATQDKIGQSLAAHYNKMPFSYFGEETEHKDIANNSKIVFIADPIDGTTNYLGKNTNWGVTLSAFSADDTEYKQPIASVIFRPMSKELLWISSEKDFANCGKTYLMNKNNGIITEHVATLTEDAPLDAPLDHKLISISLGRPDAQNYEGTLTDALYSSEASLRDNGSTALTMSMVAGNGRDGMILLGEMNKWDVAAGTQLARGSGCTIIERQLEMPDGTESPLLIVAKNQQIADELEIATVNAIYYPKTTIEPHETVEHSHSCAEARGCS